MAAADKAPATKQPARKIKVRATQTGHYDLKRYREGNVFMVDEAAFSEKWMERVAARTPESITTGKQELARRSHEISEERAGGGASAGDGDLETI